MDDLQLLRHVWEQPTPAPPAVRSAARARLVEFAGADSTRNTPRRVRVIRPAHRRAWLVSAGTAAVAAAASAAVVISTTATGPGTSEIQTTAYVVQHAERALAAVQHGSAIQQTQFAAARNLLLGANLTPPSRSPNWLGHLRFGKVVAFSYRDRTLMAGFRNGKLLLEAGPSARTRANGHQAPARPVLVNRDANTWYRPLSMSAPALRRMTCPEVSRALYDAPFLMTRIEASPTRWIALIRAALSCRQFKAQGKQRVDGDLAIKLTATPKEVAHQQGAREVLWVNSKTFLPVRISFGRDSATADFRWLQPTATNLAKLQVIVPAGAVARRLPAHTGILFWQLSQWK